MLQQLGLGCAMILATTMLHGLASLIGVRLLKGHYLAAERPPSSLHDTIVVAVFVLWLFLAMIAEVWLWAGLFLYLGALGTLEESLYFATVTFSTLGYGDVVLDKSWRLLGSFAAANGLFLFGWSTALVFVVVQRLHVFDRPKGTPIEASPGKKPAK